MTILELAAKMNEVRLEPQDGWYPVLDVQDRSKILRQLLEEYPGLDAGTKSKIDVEIRRLILDQGEYIQEPLVDLLIKHADSVKVIPDTFNEFKAANSFWVSFQGYCKKLKIPVPKSILQARASQDQLPPWELGCFKKPSGPSLIGSGEVIKELETRYGIAPELKDSLYYHCISLKFSAEIPEVHVAGRNELLDLYSRIYRKEALPPEARQVCRSMDELKPILRSFDKEDTDIVGTVRKHQGLEAEYMKAYLLFKGSVSSSRPVHVIRAIWELGIEPKDAIRKFFLDFAERVGDLNREYLEEVREVFKVK